MYDRAAAARDLAASARQQAGRHQASRNRRLDSGGGKGRCGSA